MQVPVQRPQIPPFDLVARYLRSVEQSGHFTNFGPLEQQLRLRFGEFFGVRADQVVTASNATLALAGAIAIMGRKEWIVPAFTFPASALAVGIGGGTVQFGDIREEDWTLATDFSPESGLLPVAPFGALPDIERWRERDAVVHDAAASIGSQPDLRNLPTGHCVVFSLHATKVLGSGEGSVAVFGCSDKAQRFRAWTNFGFSGSRQSQFLAVNAKMSEMQAAYVHAALDSWLEERRDWLQARAEVNSVVLPPEVRPRYSSDSTVSPYWIVECGSRTIRDALEVRLERAGIETRRWWANGCHNMEAWRSVKTAPVPVSDIVSSTYLGLPMFRGLTADMLQNIVTS